ncbi:PepSY domain-containing protein [Sphingobacterium sp. BIGb0165]|uniref:PepSY-associated TM helix domain-containing protein n=1 Tax=Sphingobacterium sp. BIGb0165 TaxID=2940615 RepID=UPI0021676EB8|nr:PepSY-associated TM helix domain-containing protein [Sphingobacterium sp. BIGb0165]MCS4226307.1 putative iron-regulated membrane protein [Sphingobacterium sp. BIGb0165]
MANKTTNKTSLKKVFQQLHLYIGLLFGLIFLTVCVTGMLLSFEKELTPLLWPKEQRVVVLDNRLPLDAIVSKARNIFPNKRLFRVEIPADPSRSYRVQYGSKKEKYWYAYISPYTGEVLSKGAQAGRFFQKVLDIHRFLLIDKIGATITGISAIATLFLAISGIYLWWPKNKKLLKQRLKIGLSGSTKRKVWDFHAVGGFYATFFLLIFTLTGLTWSFDWYNRQFFRLFGADTKTVKEKVKNPTSEIPVVFSPLETMYQQINNLYPNPGNILMTFPDQGNLAFSLTKESFAGTLLQINQAYFDSRSGKLIKNNPMNKLPLAEQMRKMVKPIHVGSVFGLPSKIIVFLAVSLAASLPITGLWIWFNKSGKKTTPRKKRRLKGQTAPLNLP